MKGSLNIYALGFSAAMLVTLMLGASESRAHCQLPCGIYGDAARVQQIREDIRTIKRAVRLIGELAGKHDAQSNNQLIRWVGNKEQHAERIIRTVSDYFLTQKIKPAPSSDKKSRAAYLQQLARHHAVMVAAMKCKQSADPAAIKTLEKAVDGIASYWKK